MAKAKSVRQVVFLMQPCSAFFHLSKWPLFVSLKLFSKPSYEHTHTDTHISLFLCCLTGCERLTWEVAKLCWSKNTGSSQPWATSVHTTGRHWSKVSAILGFEQCQYTYHAVLHLTYVSLSDLPGVLSKGHVRCPWHGACFNIATGDIEDFPGLDSLPTFQVTFLARAVTHSLTFSVSLSTVKKCTHRSCLFDPGQSWKGQGDHSRKQAGNKKMECGEFMVGHKRVTGLIWDLFQTFPGSAVAEEVKAHVPMFSSH